VLTELWWGKKGEKRGKTWKEQHLKQIEAGSSAKIKKLRCKGQFRDGEVERYDLWDKKKRKKTKHQLKKA